MAAMLPMTNFQCNAAKAGSDDIRPLLRSGLIINMSRGPMRGFVAWMIVRAHTTVWHVEHYVYVPNVTESGGNGIMRIVVSTEKEREV